MKKATEYLAEAHAVVPKLSVEEAIAKHQAGSCVFVDVRDSSLINDTGTIAGAHRIPRGMIEFVADDQMENFHNKALTKDADIYLVCGAGGQAALTGKTLKDMGFKKVYNVGGFSAWKEAGGPTEV